MTTHLTKIWWDLNKHKLVEQAIPEAEIYKREWVGLTDEEEERLIHNFGSDPHTLLDEVNARLQKRNT